MACELIGSILLSERHISAEQLEVALARQQGTPLRLGEVLIGMGCLTDEQLEAALLRQILDWRLGQILLRDQQITPEQLNAALAEQRRTGELLGIILVGQGACTLEVVHAGLRVQEKRLAPTLARKAIAEKLRARYGLS